MTQVGLSPLALRPFVEVLETRAQELKQLAQSLAQHSRSYGAKKQYRKYHIEVQLQIYSIIKIINCSLLKSTAPEGRTVCRKQKQPSKTSSVGAT